MKDMKKMYIEKFHEDKTDTVSREICSICEKLFTRRYNLVRHMREQHAENVYKLKCDICEKTFGRKSDLNMHVKAHSEAMNCRICGKHFTFRCNLLRHLRQQHTENVLDLKCNICEESFGRKSHLSMHVEKVYNEARKERNQKCNICCMAFICQYGLVEHKKRYHNAGTTWTRCEKCRIRYTRRHAYISHLSSEHDLHIQKYKFTSEMEFITWKKLQEKEHIVGYRLTYSKKQIAGKIGVYVCNRTGYKQPKIVRCRMPRRKGPCKIGVQCPSHMEVRIAKDGVYVEYIAEHWFHERELCHATMGTEVSQEIEGHQ